MRLFHLAAHVGARLSMRQSNIKGIFTTALLTVVLALIAGNAPTAKAAILGYVYVCPEGYMSVVSNGYHSCVGSAGSDYTSGGGVAIGSPRDGGGGVSRGTRTEKQVARNETKNSQPCPDGPAPAKAQAAMTNRPVMIATGTKILPETDFVIPPEEFPLKVTRAYNKELVRIGIFGARWASNLEHSLTFEYGGTLQCGGRLDQAAACNPGGNPLTAIYVNDEGGFATKLSSNGAGQWVDSSGIAVAQSGSQWVLARNDGSTEVYDSYGRPLSIKNERGIGLTYSYDANGAVSTITHSTGRTLSLTWSGSRVIAITAPNGKAYGYGYDAYGYLTSVVYPDNLGTKTYFYEDNNQPGGLTGISINGVRYSRYAYQADGKVAWSGLENGIERSTFSYTSNSTDVTNALGQTSHYDIQVVNGERQIIAVTRPATSTCPAGPVEMYYDSNGNISRTVDGVGVQTTYSYDNNQRLIQKIEGIGPNGEADQQLITDYDWDATRMTRLNGVRIYSGVNADYIRQTVYAYYSDNDARAHLLASVSEINRSGTGLANQTLTTSYDYTIQSSGLIASMTVDGPLSGNGDAVTYSYDSAGNLLSVANSLGHTTTYSNYNALGQPGHIVGVNGAITDYTYNARGQVLTEVHTINGTVYTTTTAYDTRGRPVSVTTPDNVTVSTTYDNYDRVNWITRTIPAPPVTGISNNTTTDTQYFSYNLLSQPLTIGISYTYKTREFDDTINKPVTVVNTDTQQQTTFEYDTGGFLSKRKGSNGQSLTYTYNANGDVATVTDALNHTTTYGYDRLRHRNYVKDAANGETWTVYRPQGTIDHVTTPGGATTGYAYDGLGQLWAQSSPDTGTTTFTYNSYGQKSTMARNDGSGLSYSYDNLGRLTWYGSSGTEGRTFGYDWCQNGKGYLCNADYREGAAAGTRHYGYSAEGQVTVTEDWTPNTDDWTGYSYDGMGRLAGIQYPSGIAVGYGYANSHLTTMTATINGATSTIATIGGYQAFGPPASIKYGNNVYRSWSYDLDRRLTGLTTFGAAGNLQNLTYAYDAADRLTSITDNNTATRTQQYGYDALSRLTSANVQGGNVASFGYDAVGNRWSRSDTVPAASISYGYAANNNQLQYATQAGLARYFNTNSNGDIYALTGVDGVYNGLTYDGYGRLASHTRSGVTTAYTVDALDQRAAKSNAGSSSRYIYSGFNQLLAESTNGVWSSYIWLNGEPIGLVRNGQVNYINSDHLGRPESVTNSGAAVVWKADNYGFSRVVTLDNVGGLNLGLPGQYYDVESGLWHNGFRDYEASLGRYLQSDPVGLGGGPNTYAYAGGNPISNVDPLGLTQCDIDAAIRAAAAKNPGVWFGAGAPVVDIPRSSSEAGEARLTALAPYDPRYDNKIHLNEMYLDKLSNAQLADLVDTVIHEGLHLSGDPRLQVAPDFNHSFIVPEAARRTQLTLPQFKKERKKCGC